MLDDPSGENKTGLNTNAQLSPKAMSKVEIGGLDRNGSKKLIIKESRKSIDSSPKNKKQSHRNSKEPMVMLP